MTYANKVRMSNGCIARGSSGSARLRSDFDAPNGVDLGESVFVGDSGGSRIVSITLPEADYSAYPGAVIFWRSGGAVSHWSFVPGSGTTILGNEDDVLGVCTGTLPAYEICPVNSGGLMGFSAELAQTTDILRPVIVSVAIEGTGIVTQALTVVAEVSGSGVITTTYQWFSDGVAVATGSTYTPTLVGKSVRVSATSVNSYGSDGPAFSETVTTLAADFAVPGAVTYVATTGGDTGEITVTIGASLPSAGDGPVLGDGAATLDQLEYRIDGGTPALLTGSPTALAALTVETATPGVSVLIGVRAVSNYAREGAWTDQTVTTGGSVAIVAPVYTGGLIDLEAEQGSSIVKTWSDYFTGATSYTVITGVSGPVSSGTGNVTYSGTLTTVQNVTFSIRATNSGGSTVRTFQWNVITPKIAPFIKSAFPDVFAVKIGQTIDYDATQHFGGTDLVYAIASGTLPPEVALSAVGRLKNSSPLSTLRTPANVTISATNSLGSVTSAAISVGVIVDPPAALTAAEVGVTQSVFRYGTKWRTGRMFPTELATISLLANPALMTNASASVQVTAAGHSIEVGQTFTLNLAASRGVTLTGTFTADSVAAGVSVTFTAGQTATSSGNGGGSGGILTPLWSGWKWTRNTPDANGLVPTAAIETVVTSIGAGEYQIDMTDPAKRADPDTQTPRTNFSVWFNDANDTFRLQHQVIPAGPYSAWSAAVDVPLVVVAEAASEAIRVSQRTKEAYAADLPGAKGQQFQRCRSWNQGIIDPEKRGWVVSQQDENGLRFARNANGGEDGNTVAWGNPRMDGYHGGRSGGIYLNSDDAVGVGLFVGVSGHFAAWVNSESEAGVYVGDGSMNWAKKLNLTRAAGPGPYVSGSSGPKKAFTFGGSPAGNPIYFGNGFDRQSNFVARRPQVHENQNCTVFKTTKALLDADLAYPAGTKAAVYSDATTANRAVYTKTGSSGSGSWTKGAVFLTDAQRPIYVVEQHGARSTTISYQALFKSTDGGASFAFVREFAIASFANGGSGIYFIRVAPNGDVGICGAKGMHLSTNDGVDFTQKYTRECSTFHFYGGSSTTVSGARVGDYTAGTNGGVWTTSNVQSTAFTKKFGTGSNILPTAFKLYDLECAPSNQNRMLCNGNNANGFLTTDGGTNWTEVGKETYTGDEAWRWNFSGSVSVGHSGFLFCPTNELKVVGWTQQVVSQSINGGALFEAERAAFLDGAHIKGTGTGPLTGTDPWKKILCVCQDSVAESSFDGLNYLQRSGDNTTGSSAFLSAINAAGGGSEPYASGASGVILPNGNIICGVNRNGAGQSNVMVVYTGRNGTTGEYSGYTIRQSGTTSRCTNSRWSLLDPDGVAFVGRWAISNLSAAAGSITFTDHSAHEIIDVVLDGSTQLSYWGNFASGTVNGTAIYLSDNATGANGQGTAWKTTSGGYYARAICADPHTPERVLYVSNNNRSVIREIKRVSGSLVDATLKNGTGGDVDLGVLILADFNARFPGGAPPFPSTNFSAISQLVSDPNMEGLFYAIVGVHGIPNLWMTVDNGLTWKNASENLPRTLWTGVIHPLTGDLLLDSSFGRHVVPPPTGYPSVTYKGALSAQLKAFYDKPAVPNPPLF